MTYHPPQREVRALVLSGARWIEATFHLPQLHAFNEHLCHPRPFLTLTDVQLGPGPRVPFLALRRDAAQVIVPEVPVGQLLLTSVPGEAPRDVSCFLERVVVHGSLDLLPSVRTSDFLSHQEGFLTFRCARTVPAVPGRPEPLPAIFVNARAIFAVAEEEAHPFDRRSEEGRAPGTAAPPASTADGAPAAAAPVPVGAA